MGPSCGNLDLIGFEVNNSGRTNAIHPTTYNVLRHCVITTTGFRGVLVKLACFCPRLQQKKSLLHFFTLKDLIV